MLPGQARIVIPNPSALPRVTITDVPSATSAGTVTIAKDSANGWAYAPDMKSVALSGTACAGAQGGAYTNVVARYLCSP